MISRPAFLLLLFSQIILLLFLWQQFGPDKETEKETTPAAVFTPQEEAATPLPDDFLGQKLPSIDVQAPRGEINLRSVKDPVVIEFISTSCQFCQKMAPIFSKVMRYSPVDYLVVGVGSESLGSMRLWHEKRLGVKMPGSYAFDNQGQAVEKLGLVGTPTTLFVDREGRIANFITGEFSEEELIELVADIK